MIWLAWRQHRKQALFTGIGLVLLAALLIPTGLAMRHTFVHNGLPQCLRAVGSAKLVQGGGDACDAAFNQFRNQYQTWLSVGVLFLVLPLLVGMFWGAPLVAREVEHGTHRFVWTQGVSRRRWALVKFGVVGGATLVTATAYGLGLSWWLTPLTQSGVGRLGDFAFDMQGVAPVGYTLFAVALGIFAGTVWPRMLPAMAATLVGFLGVRVALSVLARPRYLAPKTFTFLVEGTTGHPNDKVGDWVLAVGVRDASGKMVAPNIEVGCPPDAKGPDGQACGSRLGLGPGAYNWQLYQPAGRFWLFQGIETGIFVALAAVLIYLAVRRIRRIA